MHATPDQKSLGKVKGAPAVRQDQRVTRAEAIVENGGTPLMPPVDECVAYLVQYWQALGMIQSGGMGSAALSATEIAAWQDAACVTLSPWEFSTLREMSRAYIGQAGISDKPECQPPYGDPVQQIDRETVAKKVGNAMRSLLRKAKT